MGLDKVSPANSKEDADPPQTLPPRWLIPRNQGESFVDNTHPKGPPQTPPTLGKGSFLF